MQTNTYLITGATSGIGYCLARQLSESGSHVIAIGRNRAKLDEIGHLSDRITPVAFDISDVDDIETFISNIFAQHPSINVIINNAGIQDNVRLDEAGYGTADIVREIAINLTAPIEISRAALPHIQGTAEARIVNISSGLAFVPKTTSAVYSATKSGLHLFSDALRVQANGHYGVSEVILPIVETPMTEGRGTGKISAEDAAHQIISGINAKKDRIYVGKARFLPFLLRWAPSLARRIIQKS